MSYYDLKVSDLVAFVRPEADNNRSCGMPAYGHVVVSFGYLDKGCARGLSDSNSSEVANLASLRISNQLSSDYAPEGSLDGSYGWQARFRDLYDVDLDRAERMVKTLRKVERGMERENAESGYVATYGQYVARCLKVLGVRKVIVLRAGEWPHSENVNHLVRKPGEVVATIDGITRDMGAKLRAMAA